MEPHAYNFSYIMEINDDAIGFHYNNQPESKRRQNPSSVTLKNLKQNGSYKDLADKINSKYHA